VKYRGALSGKGGKWNDKTLDKWLKSPADYAPGKYLKSILQINIKNEKRFFTEKRHQLSNEILFDINK
jgi:cytochrome c2